MNSSTVTTEWADKVEEGKGKKKKKKKEKKEEEKES